MHEAADTRTQEPNAFGSALANARDIAFVMAIFLYFAGFTYRYLYQEAWGITTKQDGLDLFGYLVYAYAPLSAIWLWLLAIVVGIGLVLITLEAVFTIDRLHRVAFFFPPLRILVVAAGVISCFPLLAFGARDAAINSFRDIREGDLPATRVYFKAKFADLLRKDPPYGGQLLDDDATGNLTIVEESSDAYFVLDQPGMRSEFLPIGTLVRIPKDQVEFLATEVVQPGRPH